MGASAPGKEKEKGVLTTKQKRGITDLKGFPMRFQEDFDRQWLDAVERMRGSGVNLGKIVLAMEWGRAGRC